MAIQFPISFEIANGDDETTRKIPSVNAELVLGPFSRIPKLEFTDVEVGCEAVQILNLRNPTDALQCVVLILPKEFSERGFSLNANEFEIPPYSKAELEIRFKPVKELRCRDTIYVKDKFRNQKSQFQLTSRAVPVSRKAPRKRKTWNVNKKAVVVPTYESNVQIQSLLPETPVATASGSAIQHRSLVSASESSILNVTFPVVSVTASTPTDRDATYSVEPEPIRKLSTVFDDSLEVETPRAHEQKVQAHVKFSSRTDSFTFDSVDFSIEMNKENTSSKKERVFDVSFSDIGFDNLTPDRALTRSCLRSIENVAHNTSTPLVSGSKIKCTETTYNFTTVTTIKQEFISPQPRQGNDGSVARDATNCISAQPCKGQFQIKLEPVTPKPGSSKNPAATVPQLSLTANSSQMNAKTEPITPLASWAGSHSAFKVPPAVGPKAEAFTPIPKSDSMRKLAVAFAISPPKETQCSRRELFGDVSMCSTPREKKPVVPKACSSSQLDQTDHQEAEVSMLSRSWNVKASDVGTRRTKGQPKKTERGTTLSPKSLVAFKKNVRVHVSKNSKTSSEPTVVINLYTTDFKEPIYNLDINGATTMSDPFAHCAIHPLEFREKQGQQLIKWVNSVLTPPEEYSAYEAGVDVASLWKKSVTSDSIPLPPSRESVSSKFHKNELHLLNLRKTAHVIFKSAGVSEVLYKIYSKIDVGYISVKDDIDLHSDQGARCHLVQMLMYYNPLWLRIGLEAIYGRDIPLQPRHTVIELMHFIQNNLLSDKYIAEKNSYQNIQHLKMPKFKKEMNDFIVFKFFSLVFFLDIAKRRAIVPYDPCLFNKNSPIKESEGMINEFIKEFIKCVGHMKRNLASMGFVVSHKQTAIDEYNFAVQTHLDLRDGASLTRLMEIILQKTKLIQKLRLPAISRLQKVHNVRLAFNALMEESVNIVDVLPTDVVDGHQEKIMSLLWQILHKFLKPRIEKGALVIQRWWRKKLLNVEIARRIHVKKEMKLETAAVKIQSLWRAYYIRKNLAVLKTGLERRKRQCRLQKERKAALTIQRWFRKTKRMSEDRKKRISDLHVKSARKIQVWYRHTVATRKMKHEYMQKRLACVTIQQHYRALIEVRKQHNEYLQMKKSAVTIQRWYRATVAMKKEKLLFETKRQAVVTIQQHYRALIEGRKQRSEYQLMKESAVTIQLWYRATVAMKKEKLLFATKRQAVVTIQQHYRALIEGRKQRSEYQLMKESAVTIQRWYRATVAMKKEKLLFETKRQAVVTIQQHYRALVEGRKQRSEYQLMKESAVTIQRWYQATVAMKKEKLLFATKRQAVVTIQQHYRALIEGRKQRSEYQLMKESAVTIQRWYRATVAMKKEKLLFEMKRQAVVTIQQHYRALVEGRKQRSEYQLMKESAVTIQRWYRATAAMRTQKLEYETTYEAVVTIQQHYRALIEGRKQRSEYLLTKESSLTIQRWYRATVAMRTQKREYETIYKAVLTIQQHYRALIEGRKQRSEYLLMKESAVTIQRWYRATVAMKKEKLLYETKRQAVVTIQQHYRALIEGRKQRSEYLIMKESCGTIQRWYRATLAMRYQKLKYETTHKAVLTIQQHYRALIEMRKQRSEYLLMKESAVTIQRWYRATVAMKKEKLLYETKRQAVVTIQQHYRALIDGKKQRSEYLLTKESSVTIQRWYRATVAMRTQKLEYETIYKAVLTIQQHYRTLIEGRKQRSEYLLMKESAVTIQRWYRATVAMKKEKLLYETKRQAVVTIQQHYRALVEGRKQRRKYLVMMESAAFIQRWYRATVAMRTQKLYYETLYKAVLTIQQHYRALIEMRKQRSEYLLMKESAVTIQRWYRATVAMKKEKLLYETKLQAVVTIQQHYRALVEGRKQRSEYLIMKESCVTIQRWYRATVAMRNQKLKYETTHKAVVTIQQHYRALVTGRKQRREYLLMKSSASLAMVNQKLEYEEKRGAALVIWRWYWRCKAAQITRNNFLLLREKVIFVQTRFRALQAFKRECTAQTEKSSAFDRMRDVKKAFVQNTAASKIQKWYRNILHQRLRTRNAELVVAAKKVLDWYRLVVAMRRERQTFLSQKQAAIRIQRCYRASRRRVVEASEGAAALRQEAPTLLQNCDRAIDYLLSPRVKSSLNWTYASLKNLDFVTLHSPVLCEKLADPEYTRVYAVIYHLLDTESRSEAYRSVFDHGMNVLLHLVLYNRTYDVVWQNTLKYDGIDVLLRLMGKFLEKNEILFCRAATLIWLLSRSQEQIEVIRQTEFLKRMSYYAKKVLSTNTKVKPKKHTPALPNVKTDWGYSGKSRTKEFPTRVDAIVALHHRFRIAL